MTENTSNPTLTAYHLWKNTARIAIEKFSQAAAFQYDRYQSNNEEAARCGKHCIDFFETIFDRCHKTKNPRDMAIFYDYIGADNITYSYLGQKYELTRERIRQIVARRKRIMGYYFRKLLSYADEQLIRTLKDFCASLENIDYDLISLYEFGFDHVPLRKKRVIFDLFFGENITSIVDERSNDLKKLARQQEYEQGNRKRIDELWKFYESKICFPSKLVFENPETIKSFSDKANHHFDKKFRNKFLQFGAIVEIVNNPDLVYHCTSTTDHRPDVLLRLADGRSVLMIVLPEINMAFKYNIDRFNSLHIYCKKHGFGYLILSDRNKSIYDIKSREIDPNLKLALDSYLNSQSMIMWPNIKTIKQTLTVTNADIAAYVIQNKLNFTMNPFCIKRQNTLF